MCVCVSVSVSGSVNKTKNADGDCCMADLQEKNQSLEIEVSVLRQKLVEATDAKIQASNMILRELSSSETTMKLEVTTEVTGKQNGEVEDGKAVVEDDAKAVQTENGESESCPAVIGNQLIGSFYFKF